MSTTNAKDGGPAFATPVNVPPGHYYSGPSGMTLRDYFAAHALPAAMDFHARHAHESDSLLPLDLCAGLAYSVAEAMLARREQ